MFSMTTSSFTTLACFLYRICILVLCFTAGNALLVTLQVLLTLVSPYVCS